MLLSSLLFCSRMTSEEAKIGISCPLLVSLSIHYSRVNHFILHYDDDRDGLRPLVLSLVEQLIKKKIGKVDKD